MSSLKVINIGDPGTGFRFGGDDLDTVNMLLSGQDLGYNLKMENPFYFGGANKLRILRPDGIHYISINTEAETTNRSLLLKSFGADTYLVVGTDLLVKANLNANIAYKDETNWLATTMVQNNAITDAKINDVDWSKVTNEPATYAPSAHTHPHSDIGTNLKHSETGLTGVRTVTHPDESYKAMGELNATEFKNKTFDLRQNDPLKFARLGAYSPATSMSTPNDVWGVLRGMVSVGVPFAMNWGGLGHFHRYATQGTVANDVAGVLKLDGWLTHRLSQHKIRFGIRFNPNTSNNRRMFVGYGPQRMFTLTSDTEPISAAESGFIFGHGTADTKFQIFHNDASGACQKTTTGISLPGIATNYILEIKCNDSTPSFTATLYSVTTGEIRSTVVGSPTTITTRIPDSLTSLYMQNLVVGSTTAQQFNEPYFIEVY